MPLELYTADQLRRRGQTLTQDLNPYPERTTAPLTDTVAGRPSVADLYDKLDAENRMPVDYSGITKVNKARRESADRETLAAMAMTIMGDKGIKAAGNHVLVKALENQNPIRPNAADVGWTNPETGEFVPNPDTARTQHERLLTGRIDAITKENDNAIKTAMLAGDKRKADALAANNDIFRALLLSQGQQNANSRAISADAAEVRANKPGKEDELTTQQRTKISQHDADIATAESAIKAAEDAKSGFGMLRGLPKTLAGQFGESIAGRWDNDKETYARSRVFNEVSALIKERAGTAQSAGEMARLISFLPGDLDDANAVAKKMRSYVAYLKEQRHEIAKVVPKVPRAPEAPVTPAAPAFAPPAPVDYGEAPPGAVRPRRP
jgi:hypothetical protein